MGGPVWRRRRDGGMNRRGVTNSFVIAASGATQRRGSILRISNCRVRRRDSLAFCSRWARAGCNGVIDGGVTDDGRN